jgi:putative membrane protein
MNSADAGTPSAGSGVKSDQPPERVHAEPVSEGPGAAEVWLRPDRRLVFLWRAQWVIVLGLLGLAALVGGYQLAVHSEFPRLLIVPGFPLVLLVLLGLAVWLPPRQWEAWVVRFDGRLLEIRSGVVTRVSVLIPVSRLQHVDLRQGVIDRSLDLASLVVHTAGTRNPSHTYPVCVSGRQRNSGIGWRWRPSSVRCPNPARLPMSGQQPEVDLTTSRSLHPAALLLPLLRFLIRLAVPLLVALLWVRVAGVLLAMWVVPAASLYYIARYLYFRYRVEGDHLVVRSGWLSRTERRIPVERIQELAVRQEWYYRLFGLARVEVSTAGTNELEAHLDPVSLPEALALRHWVQSRQGAASTADLMVETGGRLLLELKPKELLLGGVTSDLVSRLAALAGAIVYFYIILTFASDFGLSGFKPPWEYLPWDPERWLPSEGLVGGLVQFALEETAGKAVGLILIGFGFALVRYVARYHGFRLTRTGSVLESAYGLFSFRRSSLRCDRIQALRVEESLLRRWFGLATITVDSAGDREEAEDAGRSEVLVPLVVAVRVPELIEELMPGIGTEPPDWQPVSRKAVWRATWKGWLVAGLVMLQTASMLDWVWLVWTPAFPLVYLVSVMLYRHTGYCLRGGYLLSRKGWLNRQTLVQPVANIQNLRLRENWFERRAGLAALSIDTAGRTNTGGGAFLHNLTAGQARQLQFRLAQQVADLPFSW